ncbi:membrane protein [Prochlorothrix hollandica PCC 9006 = CALU 1027]|uniref:Membrane protein n=2 Tax=Prochlorothrix hollandica TaxID=1223 RepID=A0A0M2Q3N5_PROHO|nr:membrane protein [Prochlorothrix hollandica PCC 9006 = CALU 1027]
MTTTPPLSFLDQVRQRLVLPMEILTVPWLQEIIDQTFFRGGWSLAGMPRSLEGVPSIFFAAFSHGDYEHLVGNTIAFAIFSWLILAKSKKDYLTTFMIGWLGGGFCCWLLGPGPVHGLSGVVYSLFGYLLLIGWLEKRIWSLGISVFVCVNYISVLGGIFPTDLRIAWWGHLIGLLLGFFAAYGVYREPQQS